MPGGVGFFVEGEFIKNDHFVFDVFIFGKEACEVEWYVVWEEGQG
jgi:hypothetical protein